jgi:flagella basal body P-ring formation protein FlgA
MMPPAALLVCVAVSGPQIVGSDLDRAGFAGVPADAAVAFSPAPGVRRVFTEGDLARIAQRFGIALTPASLCFERETKRLEAAPIIAAMRQALGAPDAEIELIAWTTRPLPSGELAFRRDDLRPPASGDVAIWNGWVQYEPTRRAAVSTSVRVRVPRDAVVAAVNVAAGTIITHSHLRLKRVLGFPVRRATTSLENAVGRRSRGDIPAGAEIHAAMLAVEPEIRRGDTIEVEVASGAARLKLTATAATQGSQGEWITVENPAGGGRFRARVAGRGLAVIGR